MLYSKGLVRFHAHHYEEALGLFEEAVESDPNDVYALYYRGVTRARLGDLEGAIRDLHAVLERKPDLREAALELGVALVDAKRGAEAIPWLEQAQQAPELDARASFFLGIAELRAGEEAAAEANFERAAKLDSSLTLASLYYRGVAAYQASRWQEAEDRFRRVSAMSPSSRLGREAADFLISLQGLRGRSFQLYADVALEYDSNVTIAPDNQTLKDEFGVSDEDDGLVAVTAGASYAPVRTQRALLNVGYEFFQSFYFDLTDFNLQDHRPNVELVGRFGDARIGLQGRYDYYTLDAHKFLQEVNASPWFTFYNGATSRIDVWFRMRYRDFLDSDFEIRDGFNYSTGSRLVLNLGDWSRFAFLGYRYDRESPNGGSESAQAFGYDGNEVSTGLGWTFPADIWADVSYAYRRERYDADSQGRRDNEHRILAGLSKQLTDSLLARCTYFGTINDSNQNLFQYDRHIVSVSLEVRY